MAEPVEVHVPQAGAAPEVVQSVSTEGGAVVAGALERVHEEASQAQEAAGVVHGEVQAHQEADQAEHGALAVALAGIASRLDEIDRRQLAWEQSQVSQTVEASSPAGAPVEVAVPPVNPEETPAPSAATSAEAEPAAVVASEKKQAQKRSRFLIHHPMRRS